VLWRCFIVLHGGVAAWCAVAAQATGGKFRGLVERSCKGGKAKQKFNVPLAEAAASSKIREPSGFVFHQSRVGSTLVANMLASVSTHLVYSESFPSVDGACSR
jgi:hypothetical protein